VRTAEKRSKIETKAKREEMSLGQKEMIGL